LLYYLNYNIIQSTDDYFSIGSRYGQYFDIGFAEGFEYPVSFNNEQGTFLQIRIRLYTEQYYYSRVSYNMFNVMSDVGGVSTTIMIIFGALSMPFSKHIFFIDFLKYQFLAKTK